MLALMFIVMIILLLSGFPMLVPLLAAPVVLFFVYFPGLPQTVLIQQIVTGISPMSLIAVPMFIFAADIMTNGQSSRRIINLVTSFVGHIHGGLAVSTTAACTLFGAVSGSTQATVAAIGGPLRPELLKNGYSSSFSTALIINASDIALLIPPSIGMIIFGVIAKESTGELFIAGIGPGLLILVLFSVYCYIYARVKAIPLLKKAGAK